VTLFFVPMSRRVWIRRAYEAPSRNDGYRVLVDRLWPRGVSKADAHLDEWVRDLAPSTELRQWFGHDPQRWEEFRRRYRDELGGHADVVARLVDVARHRRVTLVFGARDTAHNDAVVLREVIDAALAHAG
jgi:uncharacterized protein YeaO (DUF488 family)